MAKRRYSSYRKNNSRKKLKYILLFIITLLILSFFYFLFSSYAGYVLTHPPKKQSEPLTANILPDYSEVEFYDNTRELTLKGLYFKPSSSKNSKKSVIISHGYKQNQMLFDLKTSDLVKFFLKNNFNVLIYDLRAHGTSSGNSFTFGLSEQNDIIGAVKYCKSQGASSIVLLGYSLSGTTSIIVAGNNDLPIDAVIADSPSSDVNSFISDNFTSWMGIPNIHIFKLAPLIFTNLYDLDFSSSSPIQAIKNITDTSVLLIHGKNDPLVPISNSIELFTSNSSKTELWQVESSSHASSFLEDEAKYLNKLSEFLNKVYEQ